MMANDEEDIRFNITVNQEPFGNDSYFEYL